MKMILTPATTPDEYIDCLAGWQRSFAEALRNTVRAAAPELQERLKWGHLVYFTSGPVLIIRAEPTRVLFGFMRGQRLRHIEPRLKPGGKYELATLELRQDTPLLEAVVAELAIEATRLNRALGDPRAAAKVNVADVTTETLQAFADAWNRHDVEALMAFMTDDCVFEASAGPDICGTRYAGREAVRAGFSAVWATFPDARWSDARHCVFGDRGLSEWTFTGTRADGTRVEVQGCDLFSFRDGKISLKDSYRKTRSPLGGPKP